MSSTNLELVASYEEIRAIGPWLLEVLEPLGPTSAGANAGPIELAVHELATNSIDHAGCTTISIDAELGDGVLDVVLADNGQAFAGRAEPAPTEPQVRGYGLMIIEQLADSIEYERADSSNSWKVRFVLHDSDAVSGR